MRLKKLEIIGFKSFADKTEIFFDKGVTCIVGPNGCGKSNVSDSIRWVLGERSAKLLRGSSMEDVIFNGTEIRKPLAYAEVSLTIDNTDRGIPIEYGEVTIARRLYRTGESEYLLNKTICRLKDIQDLILDTGIGSSSYSMIEQGRIDYILKADPEERRFLIEEAAGIAKYKTKKDESLRKLERTEENLKRLRDIVFEVQKNIQYAERQAKRAERYKQEYERLKGLEIKHAFYSKQKIEEKKSELDKNLRAKKNESQNLEQKIQTFHQTIEAQESVLREVGQRCQEKEGERYKVLSQSEKNEQKLQFIRESRLQLAQQRGQLLQEQDQLRQSIDASAQKKTELDGLVTAKNAEKDAFQVKLTEASEALNRHESVIREAKEKLEAIRKEFFEAAQVTVNARNEFHRCKVLSEGFAASRLKEEADVGRFTEQITEWNQKLQGCLQELESKNAALQGILDEQQTVRGNVAALEFKLAELRKDGHDHRLALREKESRLQTLTEMEQASWSAFGEFLNEVSNEFPDLVRSVKDIVKAQDGYEWAIDVGLGQFVRSLVVNDASAARTIIEKLNLKKSFSAGILLKDPGQGTPTSSEAVALYASLGFRPLAEVVSVEPGYELLIKDIFVAETFPLQSLDLLLGSQNSACFLSRDGLFLDSQKRLYFWSDSQRSQFLYSRETEISRIRQEIDSGKTGIGENESHVTSTAAELENTQTQLSELETKRTNLLLEKESLETEKKNIEERLQSFHREIDLIQAEILSMEQETLETQRRMEQLQVEMDEKEQNEKRLYASQGQSEKDLEALLTQQQEFLIGVQQCQSQAEQYRLDLEHLQDSLRLITDHAQQDEDRLAFLETGKERFAEKEKEFDQDEATCITLMTEYQQQLHTVDVDLELLRKEQTEQESVLFSQRRTIEELSQSLKVLQDEEHQISMQQMDFDYQLKNVGERLMQRYRINLAELNPQDYSFTEEEMQGVDEIVAGLQTKVDSLGTVNLLAIDEYQELKQRYDFLLAQQKDLEDARDSLMEAIRTINRTTKQLFEDTFTQVQESFKEYYQTLFRGGEARLSLIDETHPLESGIDIVVRPPGKKLQNMSLLSGGEKALTAVALLFALFKIRPSPFCLLDEVDAPLDEANIDRFLTVLRSFIDTTQFLIITHNRKTIAMGDSLYGVTMEEPGVSKIVSVKVRAGDESLPGEDLHPTVAAENESEESGSKENQATTDTVSA